ncbi:hypothetical protein J3459_012140 [Metarhizium acridum]|uniref:uncharacterized protein n=1 Tax=Metarhizium acridum TaxID=92637 RepID=UPI001C6AB718|nr:hypothetical protein J3459_012140 [Metarhizium acridum]KAG8425670.1 hypothetical protein J3458_002350 [Metarhizium acridum]
MIDRHYTPDRDDMKGVIFTLYEIITLDEPFREVPHEKQDAEAVLQMEWLKHPKVQLDSDIQTFRGVLDTWLAKRKGKEFKPKDTWVQWPWMPKPPAGPVLTYGPEGKVTGKEMRSVRVLIRNHLVQMGEPYWDWERPASYRLREVLGKDIESEGKKVRNPPAGEAPNRGTPTASL